MKKRILSLITAFIMVAVMFPQIAMAADTSEGRTMVTSKTCNYYQSKSGDSIVELISMGTELKIGEIGATFTEITYKGAQYYILTQNLMNISYTVTAQEENVYSDTNRNSEVLTTLMAGDRISGLEVITKADGSKYLYCTIEETDVTGYIPMNSVRKSVERKVINTGGIDVYDTTLENANDTSVCFGEEVDVLMDVNGWTKIIYDNQIRYIRPKYLNEKVEYVTAGRTALYADASLQKTAATLYWDTPVTVYETFTFDGEEYVRCSNGQTTGFVKKSDIGSNRIAMTKGNADLRDKAKNEGTVIADIAAFETFTILAENEYWAKVAYDGKTGYVYTGAYELPEYTANGDCYDSAEDLVMGNPEGTINENVLLEAESADGKYARVKTASGELFWIQRASVSYGSEIKVINTGTSVYETSSIESAKTSVYSGEEVEVLRLNENWAKVIYNGEVRYINPERLDAKIEYVTAESTEMYADSLLNEVSDTLYWNTPVTVYETFTFNGVDYVRCSDGQTSGFVKKSDIGDNRVAVTPGNTSMREKAYNESAEIADIPAHEKYNVLYVTDNWVKVSYDGKTGYVYKSAYQMDEYLAEGSYYTSAEALVNGQPTGTVSEDVFLVAESDDGKYAYVKNNADDYYWVEKSSLTVNDTVTVLYLNTERRWIRNEPSNECDGVEIPYLSRLEVINYDSGKDGWYKVNYEGQRYYLWMDADDPDAFTATAPTYEYEYTSDIQKQIIDLSMQYLEVPTKYVTGGSKAEQDSDGYYMFDCSGFASYVLNSVMQQYNPLYRVSANITTLYDTDEICNIGYKGELKAQTIKKTDIDELQAGDILFFNLLTEEEEPGKYCDHCAIYLGNGEFIHSSSSWAHTSVILMPLKGNYLDKLIYAKRLVPNKVVAAEKEMYVTDYANFYSRVGDDKEIIELLKPGAKVTVNFVGEGTWSYVTYNGTKGYVSTEKLAYVKSLAAPGNFKVKLNSKDKPELTWNRVTGASQYKIYRSETGKAGSYKCIYTTVTTSYANSGALKGSKYYYKVAAVSVDGTEGPATAVKSVRVPMLAANVYIGLNDGKPKLSWYRVNGAAKYEIYRSTTGKSGSFKRIDTIKKTSAKTQKYRDASAPSGKTCYYRVRPVTPEGTKGSYSKTVSVLTRTAAPVLTTKVNTSGKPVVSWKKVTGAVKYEVYCSATGKAYSKVKTVTGTAFTHSSASKGKNYYYKVRAINKNGVKSEYSKVAKQYAKPSAVKVSKGLKSGKPKLSWKAVTGAKKYEIYRGTSKNGKYTKLKTVTSRNYIDKKAKKGKTYYYKVRVVTPDGTKGNYSTPVMVKATK